MTDQPETILEAYDRALGIEKPEETRWVSITALEAELAAARAEAKSAWDQYSKVLAERDALKARIREILEPER